AHRLLILTAVLGCAGGRTVGRTAQPVPRPASPVPAASVDSLLATLTVRQRVGQVVVPWLSGSYTASDDSLFQVAARWGASLEVDGLIISLGSPLDIAAKLNALQQRSRLPLLVSADLEWGAGMRVVGATAFPQIMAVGATGDPRDAYTIGAAAAVEGRAVGIHVNFAPDADVNNNPANPIINIRSFGEDPRTVSRLVTEYVRGLHDHGMLATLKHFPGHGDTQIDSHIGLPLIPSGYARLDSIELVPFRAGIATGRITPQRLEQSVRRVLEIKRRLGLFQSRTVPLDSIMLVVGARRFQDQADDVAVRALTLVRDVGGRLHALRAHRSRLAL